MENSCSNCLYIYQRRNGIGYCERHEDYVGDQHSCDKFTATLKRNCQNCRSSCLPDENSIFCTYKKCRKINHSSCEHFSPKKKRLIEETPARKFWRKRNWIKFRLSGLEFLQGDSKHLTLFEQDKIRQMKELKDSIIENWNKNNRIIKAAKADKRED